jgi:hypothetical protein
MVYISKKRSERVVETVDFFPTEVPLLFPSSRELETQAATQLMHALSNLKPAGPLCQVGDKKNARSPTIGSDLRGCITGTKRGHDVYPLRNQ